LLIQSKNDLLRITDEKKIENDKYNLEELLKKVG